MTIDTTTTIVVNIKDLDDNYPEWRDNPDIVYIGRGSRKYTIKRSKWGNPHTLRHKHTAKDRDNVIRWYRSHLLNSPELLEALPELKGCVLVNTFANFENAGNFPRNGRNCLEKSGYKRSLSVKFCSK